MGWSWNYRVIRDRHTLADGEEYESFTVREVYYDDSGRIASWTEHGCYPAGETWVELVKDHETMARAFTEPIVDVSGDDPVEVPNRL